jgi:hypothetical protein
MTVKFHATIFKSSTFYLLVTFLLALTLNACGPVTPIISTPTAVSSLPDLAITSAYVSMVDNNGICLGYYGFNVTVVNQGNAPASDVLIAETNTGQQVGIGRLDAHQSISMPFVTKSARGAYTVVADPQNVIVESNESNNSATFSESTATPPADCPLALPQDSTPTPFSVDANTPLPPDLSERTATPGVGATPLQEVNNYFRNFKVISDTPGGLVFSVDYNYAGDKGDIRYGAGCLDRGLDISCVEIDSAHFQPYHGASNGTFIFRIGLNGPDKRTTDQIYVGMYVWGSGDLIAYQSFDYVKHWDAVLPTPTLVPTPIVTP